MSLTKPTPPLEVRRAHTAGLADFIDPGSGLGSLLLHNSEACCIYSLVLKKVATASPLDKIEPVTQATGWRFIAGDYGQSGAVHIGAVNSGVIPKVTGFSSEPEVGDAIDSLRQLEAMPVVGTANFQLRLLRVPWLRFEAFWLHTSNGEGDVVVPYSGFPGTSGLEFMTPYSASAFFEKILTPAQDLYAKEARDRVDNYKAEAERAKKQALSYEAAHKASLADAKRMEACAKVLYNVNTATEEEIQLALEIEGSDARQIVDNRAGGAYKNVNDFLKRLPRASKVKQIAQKRMDRLGFGEKALAAGSKQ